MLTGIAGVVAATLAAVLLRDWLQPTYLKTLSVLGLATVAMVAVDLLVYGVDRNVTTGLSPTPLRAFDPVRLAQKLVGLALTLGAMGALYAVLPEYARDFYQPFRDAALYLLPIVLVVAPFYVTYVDRRQREPVDGYAQLARLLGGHRPDDWTVLKVHVRGWLVKGFFIPLMFVYINTDLSALWSDPVLPVLDFQHIFSRLYDYFFLLDVLIACIAYTVTLRVLDNHIRSVEPTVGGWVICLICYPPIADVQAPYIQYETDDLRWGAVLAPYPWLYAIWGTLILALVFIYAWSTVSFGLRFSNLTNRGIITSGPYRWVKHPAYLSKNLSWWLISVPFVAGAGWQKAVIACLMLGAVNLIYYMRTRTEERHLRVDPAYRRYEEFIAAHGLFALLSQQLQRRALDSRPAA